MDKNHEPSANELALIETFKLYVKGVLRTSEVETKALELGYTAQEASLLFQEWYDKTH